MLVTALLLFAAMQPDLAIDSVSLPGGSLWKIASPAFRVDVVLKNQTDRPLTLWDPKNTEGSVCPVVLLRAADGHTFTLRPLGIERSGVPTVVTVAPGGTVRLTLDLAKMHADTPLTQGKYQARAIYRNQLGSAGPHRNVWTGEIQSAPFELTVQ
jgi:hypothetical protein